MSGQRYDTPACMHARSHACNACCVRLRAGSPSARVCSQGTGGLRCKDSAGLTASGVRLQPQPCSLQAYRLQAQGADTGKRQEHRCADGPTSQHRHSIIYQAHHRPFCSLTPPSSPCPQQLVVLLSSISATTTTITTSSALVCTLSLFCVSAFNVSKSPLQCSIDLHLLANRLPSPPPRPHIAHIDLSTHCSPA